MRGREGWRKEGQRWEVNRAGRGKGRRSVIFVVITTVSI